MSITRLPAACVLGIHAALAHIDVVVAPAEEVEIRAGRHFVPGTEERVTCALRATGHPLASGSYLFDLVSPIPPAGGDRHLDLPVAVGAFAASGGLGGAYQKWMLAGELALDGTLRPVRGAVLLALAAAEMGLAGVVLPRANAAEAALVDGVEVRAADTLRDVLAFLRGDGHLDPAGGTAWAPAAADSAVDYAEVKGHEAVKRALEVAAAGAHNVVLLGPPGSGKTMLARRLPGILPGLTRGEVLEVAMVHSVAGILQRGATISGEPPFRSPHATISDVGMVGGGAALRPGEASLAHRGVLFLDELAEFRRNVLSALRHPLDERRVVFTRAGVEAGFPAAFMLVAAMNPCPCGHAGDMFRRCTCTPLATRRYLDRVPGPLHEHVDLHVNVPAVRYADLSGRGPEEPSVDIRERVERAREAQRARFAGRADLHANAGMSVDDVKEFCRVGEGGEALLRTAINRLSLSARAYHRVLKIARTLADLDGGGDITSTHVSDAIQYRSLDRAAIR